MRKPLIGISAYEYLQPGNGWRFDTSYAMNAAAIEKAGGLPILIPTRLSNESLRGIYERLDGVMLPGGGDINPTRYQDAPQAELLSVDDDRDDMEFTLTDWALADDLPLLGICRGFQVLNVALGGSLVQDIPSMVDTELSHSINRHTEKRNTLLHEVRIQEDSKLAQILGSTTVRVNSMHHQAVKKIADGVQITAHAPDGLIEGFELPDKYFAVAVQWHPEDLVDDDVQMLHLFEAFVQAARENMTD